MKPVIQGEHDLPTACVFSSDFFWHCEEWPQFFLLKFSLGSQMSKPRLCFRTEMTPCSLWHHQNATHPFSLLQCEPEGYNASISVCEKNFEWQLPLHFLDLKGDMTDMMSPSAFFHLWNSMVKSFHQTLREKPGQAGEKHHFWQRKCVPPELVVHGFFNALPWIFVPRF